MATGRDRAANDFVSALLFEHDGRDIGEAMVAAARAHLGMELAFLSEFVGERQVVRVLDGDGQSFGTPAGSSIPLEASYCPRVARGVLPERVADARADPLVRHMAITREAGIGAYISVPVRLADGRVYGSLCALSHDRTELGDRDARFMRVLAAIIAGELARDPERVAQRRAHAEKIGRVLEGDGLRIVFQPIVRLADRAVIGVEALARFDDEDVPRAPDEWFAVAWDVGLGAELELLAVRRALEAFDDLPAGVYLGINADPRTVQSAAFAGVLDGVEPRRILVELTEHTVVTRYDGLRRAMRPLRRRGVRFAVDDAGAGFSGLNHMVRVAPDVIKLDRFLIAGVDGDRARRALSASAAAFAAATRTTLIAEGVETEGELRALQDAGVAYGQGFHLGRPSLLA